MASDGTSKPGARGVAAGVLDQAHTPGPEHARLEVFIGKWINEGQTIVAPGETPTRILTSDVYEWMPGRFFVLHTAYGLFGDLGAGGTEIIGYDPAAGAYVTHFFDSQGKISIHKLTVEDDTWRWQGTNARSTVVLSENGRVQTVRDERSDDGATWVHSMDVRLVKVY